MSGGAFSVILSQMQCVGEEMGALTVGSCYRRLLELRAWMRFQGNVWREKGGVGGWARIEPRGRPVRLARTKIKTKREEEESRTTRDQCTRGRRVLGQLAGQQLEALAASGISASRGPSAACDVALQRCCPVCVCSVLASFMFG